MGNYYTVFGAAGSIGVEIAIRLAENGHTVDAVMKDHQRFNEFVRRRLANGNIRGVTVDDVSDPAEVGRYAFEKRSRLALAPHLAGVIYAVGHCPPGGFAEAVKYPLSELPLERYKDEIVMHQVGVLNVFQKLLPHVADGGCFLFLSSAITRLKRRFPPSVHVEYHVSVIAAEDWLIDGMRHDPLVNARGIKIHRIAPGAVDTSFHHGEGLQPKKLIPLSTVVDEVVAALTRPTHFDKEIPPPA